jgi:hypothetical protein
MRRISVVVILILVSLPMVAQQPGIAQPVRPIRPDEGPHHTPPGHLKKACCPSVYDATGKMIGEIIRWDDRFQSIQLWAYVRYPMTGGDVALLVSPEAFQGVQQPGGSVALFTTPDCSGTKMFAMLSWPPLLKRYGMVLLEGSTGSLLVDATKAWLWVTDPLPQRVSPGGTVFHSQWSEQGTCSPYPAPGYVVSGTPIGGYWMTKSEDLYKRFKRPYYSE